MTVCDLHVLLQVPLSCYGLTVLHKLWQDLKSVLFHSSVTEDPKKQREKARLMKSVVKGEKMVNQKSRKSQLINIVPVDKFFCILNHQPVVFYNISMLKRQYKKVK